MKELPEFVSVKDMMRIFGKCRTTVYLWEKKGWIPQRRRIGGSVGWDRNEVLEHYDTLPKGIGAPPAQLRQAIVEKKVGRKKRKKRATYLHELDPCEADRIRQIHEVADRGGR